MKTAFKKPNKRTAVFISLSVGIVALCLMFTIFRFPGAFGRLWDSVKDFGLSFGYYFQTMFRLDFGVVPTVSVMPDLSRGNVLPFLPVSADAFGIKMSMFGNSLITSENFVSFITIIARGTLLSITWLLLFLPPIVGIYFLIRKWIYKPKKERLEDTLPLRCWKRVSKKLYLPVKTFFVDYVDFVRSNRSIWEMWIVIWAFNFNFFTVVIEAFAWVLYFAASMDLVNLYVQFYKLALDLSGLFAFFPWWCWCVVGYAVVHWLRRRIGFRRLHHMEMKDRGFINSLPIVVMICGSMGMGKNVLEVDMMLSQTVMFRDRAYEGILKHDLEFPNFPWLTYETELKKAMESGAVFNLASCRKWVKAKCACFEKDPFPATCFWYDYDSNGLYYNDNLTLSYLWDTLETYAQLYLIYVLESSLLVTNYAVREDDLLISAGNFPLWNHDFFKRDPRLMKAQSRHSHILDFDVLRLGKKMIEDNPYLGSFEWGVIAISEVGKERGNTIELKEVKRSDETANQKNDLLNWWLKMCRHTATVDYFPFIKVFTDEQRPESWGADARDLCNILTIVEKSESKIAMPWFFLEELFHDFVFGRFMRLYQKYRYTRGDNSLFLHVVKTIVTKFEHWYTRLHHQFDFRVLSLATELGTQDGEKKLHNYYLTDKKVYSKRYAPDCFGDFFAKQALSSQCGLQDYAEYESERATLEELQKQHGYFITTLAETIDRGKKDETGENRPNTRTAEKEAQTAQKKGGKGEAV